MASERIVLKEVILSFPQNLFVPGLPPNAQPGAKRKYNCQFLMEADSEQRKLVDEAIQRVAKAAWEKDWQQTLRSIEGNTNRMAFIDGNRRIGYRGYENRWGLSSGRREEDGAPTYWDRGRKPITQAAGLLYGGAIVNAVIDIFSYDKPGRGISSGLNVVQFVRHGESFGGASPVSAEILDELDFEEDEDSLDDLA